jgi:hypothetical protein
VLERVRAKLKETTWQAFYQTMVEQRPAVDVAGERKLSVASVYKANYRVKQMLLQEYRHLHARRGNPGPLPGPEHGVWGAAGALADASVGVGLAAEARRGYAGGSRASAAEEWLARGRLFSGRVETGKHKQHWPSRHFATDY